MTLRTQFGETTCFCHAGTVNVSTGIIATIDAASPPPKEGDTMLKRLFIVLAVIAAFGLVAATPAPSDAKPVKKVYVKKNVKVYKGPKKNVYVVGHSYGGHVYYGRNRHRWHGKWYAYGVGPCWINIGGIWFWNVAVCP
jgi:hypothetical protein